MERASRQMRCRQGIIKLMVWVWIRAGSSVAGRGLTVKVRAQAFQVLMVAMTATTVKLVHQRSTPALGMRYKILTLTQVRCDRQLPTPALEVGAVTPLEASLLRRVSGAPTTPSNVSEK